MMPTYVRVDIGFSIAPRQIQQWSWNWFGDSLGPPNRGPVIFMADPKGLGRDPNHTKQVRLITYDLTKCRGAPNDPHGREVFYEFKIRNDSDEAVLFDIEIIGFKDLMR
jgi:hypothetical protein